MIDIRLSAARALAKIAHRGQLDFAREDYFSGHLIRVAESLPASLPRAAGYLHDILEDTNTTEDDLFVLGIDAHVISMVTCVTRLADETYFEFIERIRDSGEPGAVVVKIADVKDHLRDTRWISKTMVKRYQKALVMLTEE